MLPNYFLTVYNQGYVTNKGLSSSVLNIMMMMLVMGKEAGNELKAIWEIWRADPSKHVLNSSDSF